MKRFLSLLLSISLLLSVNICTIQVSANAEDVTMIERSTTLIDMTGVEDYVLAIVNNASKQRHIKWNNVENTNVTLYLNTNTTTVYADSKTFPGNTVIKIPQADLTYIQFTTSASRANSQKVSLTGKVYYTASGTPTWNMRNDNVSAVMTNALNANKWYSFEVSLDMTQISSNLTVTYTEILSSESSAEGAVPHTFSKTFTSGESVGNFRHYTGAPGDATVYYDDIKIIRHEAPYEKAEINSIGSDGEVEDGQNIVTLNLSNSIPGLTKEHITIQNKEKGTSEEIDSIVVSDGGSNHTVDIKLKNNLPSWAEYDVTIDALAFGEGAKQKTGDAEAIAVTDITDVFRTKKPPFAMKEASFTNEGSNLKAEALVVNTTGDPKNFIFVFSSFDSNGRPLLISPASYTNFTNSVGETKQGSINTADGESFNFFVIDNWTNKTPLFGKNYTVNSQGEEISPEAVSSAEALSDASAALGEFDYDNKKIAVTIDTKLGKIVGGVLYVYKTGETLNDGNLPEYAQTISTKEDGRVLKEILLPEDLAYDEYTVDFVSEEITLSETFNYYSPSELLEIKKQAIVTAAKASGSAEELKQVILGCNSAGETINDNFSYISAATDLSVYNTVANKDSVFALMFSSISSVANFDALCSLMESTSQTVRTNEINTQKSQILSQATGSTTASGLMQVILGIDSKENVVNDNFELISASADLTVYNSLKNKAATFSHMITTVKNAADWNGLISIFEAAARTQKTKENTPASPSSNNSSYGGSSNVVKETVDPSDVTSAQTSASSRFTDMNGHWASAYVEELYNRGIMKGYEDGSFRGDNSITRAELAKTLVETFAIASGEGKSFADVASGSWYASYVANAATAGIVTGYEDGSFKPEMEVNRQDAVLMLYRALSIGRKLPIGYTFFTDDLDISDYASGAIRTLGDLGIVSGNDAKEFKPLSSITRAEVATIICRAIDYIESH